MTRPFAALLLACAISVPALAGQVAAQDSAPSAVTPGSTTPWQAREGDLVTLSRLLGGLHHYHLLCMGTSRTPDLFRIRMKELVGLEEPYDALETRMVAAFNDGYQTASANYTYCSREAERQMQRLATEGDQLAERLGAPYRQIENYDYSAGTE